MAATNFYTQLLNLGIKSTEATILDTEYPNEPDFSKDMELIASWVALKQLPAKAKPKSKPWKDIYDEMLSLIQSGTDIQTAFFDSVKSYAHDLRQALITAVGVRHKKIEEYENRKANKKRFKSDDYITQLTHFGYSFRLNELDDTIEVNGEKITDAIAAEIRTKMRDAGFYQVTEIEDAYFSNANNNRYHPVKDYLNSLQYDGGNYIAELASHFIDKYGMFDTWLRRWLIGACAKVFEAEQNRMLVLDGKQEIGKSEFVKWLARSMPKHHIQGSINPDDKDCILRLANKWVWEVSELGATVRRADIEALKAFITTETITVRKAYGRHDIIKPAMCSFIGTINNSTGIFSDPTGSRRYMLSHIQEIDWNYSKLDPDKVWAEAMTAYLAGEKWRLVGEEREKANEINEQYDVEDPIEGILKKYFYVDQARDDWWIATADILHVLEDPNEGAIRGNTTSNAMKLSAVMTKLGLEKARGYNHNKQRVWGYKGISFVKMVP